MRRPPWWQSGGHRCAVLQTAVHYGVASADHYMAVCAQDLLGINRAQEIVRVFFVDKKILHSQRIV